MTNSSPGKTSHRKISNQITFIALVIVTLAIAGVPYVLPLHSPHADTADWKDHARETFYRHAKNVPNETSPSAKSEVRYQVVFSTSCSDQQHWESMVFFYHAYKVDQPGNVTRILSGCDASNAKHQADFFRKYIKPMRPGGFHLHMTPDYASLKKAGGHPYKYMNKPYGLRHWMEHVLGMGKETSSKFEDDILILMDPDMILLRPITHDFSDQDNYIWVDGPLRRRTTVVSHGFPMAQQDGYLNSQWMTLDGSHITGNATIIPKLDRKEGPLSWNTGPPYLATVRDMYRIAVKWTEFTPRVLDVYPQLFAEMYGFIWASVVLNLPFTMIKSLVVSTTTTIEREGWAFVDALPNDQVCEDDGFFAKNSDFKLPVILHYCKRYYHGPMFFSKYRLRKNIMDCDKPLLEDPPLDLVTNMDYNYSLKPPLAVDADKVHKRSDLDKAAIKSRKVAKRESFMLCALTRTLNEALINHKETACPTGTANLKRTYTVLTDPAKY